MKPILFYTEMVRAILDGRKTVTRRIVKGIENTWDFLEISDPPVLTVTGKNGMDYEKRVPGTWATFEGWNGKTEFPCVKCPYSPGDILYVRETWNYGYFDGSDDYLRTMTWFVATKTDYSCVMKHCCHYVYRADFTGEEQSEMGIEHDDGNFRIDWRPSTNMPKEAARLFLRVKGVRVERLHRITVDDEIFREGIQADYDISAFHEFWDTTLKPADRSHYGWDANPWVWAIEFERISREEAYQ